MLAMLTGAFCRCVGSNNIAWQSVIGNKMESFNDANNNNNNLNNNQRLR